MTDHRSSKLPKGVFRRKDSDEYYAKIGCNGEQIVIGTYNNRTEAARAYDQKAKELFGEFARLNFPEED